MKSLKVYSELNSLLKQWMMFCRLEKDLSATGESIKKSLEQEEAGDITLPSELHSYASDLLALNDKKKFISSLRDKEQALKSEIFAAENELAQAQKTQKTIITIVVVLIVIIAICLLFI